MADTACHTLARKTRLTEHVYAEQINIILIGTFKHKHKNRIRLWEALGPFIQINKYTCIYKISN